jgi:hypothetical protein
MLKIKQLTNVPLAPFFPIIFKRISHTKNLTLVVSLQETLVYCTKNEMPRYFPIGGLWCLFRPHWKEFLERASKDYELILWSSGKMII